MTLKYSGLPDVLQAATYKGYDIRRWCHLWTAQFLKRLNWAPAAQFEPVSVRHRTREPIRNKVVNTQRERRCYSGHIAPGRMDTRLRACEPVSDINGYYDQWNKADERQRNEVTLREHPTYIGALATKNPKIIELACNVHLNSARKTLLRSTQS